MSAHYEFDLPVGALVQIGGQSYRHLGGGAFVGREEGDRPRVIESVREHNGPWEGIDIRVRTGPLPERMWRGLHFCFGPDDAEAKAGFHAVVADVAARRSQS